MANPRSSELYVANASSDSVSVIDARSDRLVATIGVAPVAGAPKGSMPEGLAVSPDGGTLYVAEAGENAVAVVDLATRKVRGFIPTAWYPADVKVTPNGRRLVVVNTNGFGDRTQSLWPVLAAARTRVRDAASSICDGYFENQYSGTMIRGSVQVIDLPRSDSTLAGRLAAWTTQVRRNNHIDERSAPKPTALNAIKHVIYVIKENRTYDQVFGDLGKGNGDPELNLFGDESAPNHSELARRFVLLDNFYVDAEVSQDGHPWSTQAMATDYVDKTWPFDYAWAYYRSYDSEYVPLAQQFPTEPLASDPTVPRSAVGGDGRLPLGQRLRPRRQLPRLRRGHAVGRPRRIAQRARSLRPDAPAGALRQARRPEVPGLEHGLLRPRGPRARVGARVPSVREERATCPVSRSSTSRTTTPRGRRPKWRRRRSYMADNDVALGRLVDAVSHSKYWAARPSSSSRTTRRTGPTTSTPTVRRRSSISPYTQHATVDSTHYDTAAMLATIEDLLGLSPMSIFDQRATRMWPSFGSANLHPYNSIEPTVIPYHDPGYPTNSANARSPHSPRPRISRSRMGPTSTSSTRRSGSRSWRRLADASAGWYAGP